MNIPLIRDMICLVLIRVLHKQDSHSMSVDGNPCYPANKIKMKHLLITALKRIKTLINILSAQAKRIQKKNYPN